MGKKPVDPSVKDRGAVKACSRFYAFLDCLSSQSRARITQRNSRAIDVNQRFLVSESISVDII